MSLSSPYYSYWLVPQAPDLADFQHIINTLAARFDTVPFCPHVTLYSGALSSEVEPPHLLSALGSALASVQPMELTISGLQPGSQFSRTLYVQLRPSPQLEHLVDRLVAAIAQATTHATAQTNIHTTIQTPSLDPHLSLLYHSLDAATKQTLMEHITLPRSTIRFDHVQVIAAPQNFESQAHVTRLRRIHSQLLSPL